MKHIIMILALTALTPAFTFADSDSCEDQVADKRQSDCGPHKDEYFKEECKAEAKNKTQLLKKNIAACVEKKADACAASITSEICE